LSPEALFLLTEGGAPGNEIVMARLIYKTGPHPGVAIELRPGLNRIGRHSDNDIQIPDPSVSSFHCEMQVSDIGVAFRDLGSTNGSYVDGRQITKEMLTAGKTLRLGTVDFDVEIPQVNIAIPERPKVEEIFANFLPDGTAACQKHGDVAAAFQCQKCEKTWCEQCVRRTGLVGSANATISCVECGGICGRITYATSQKKKSIFERIGDTMRLIKPK
jgi:hypothetical protein